ncbi:MAG TPA: hypothetical protein VKZ44_06495 [Taishania sp.]|nr:hypothetical protein [Taishania sp.]
MKARIIVLFLLFHVCSFGQYEKHAVKEFPGTIFFEKNDESLRVYGMYVISSEFNTTLSKLSGNTNDVKLLFQLGNDCKLIGVSVLECPESSELKSEITAFCDNLLKQFREKNLHHLFQFDNELGFVNQDNCVDDLVVHVKLVEQ